MDSSVQWRYRRVHRYLVTQNLNSAVMQQVALSLTKVDTCFLAQHANAGSCIELHL